MDSSIDKYCKIVEKWLPPIRLEDKVIIMEALTGPESTLGAPILKKYIEFIKPYTEILGFSGKGKQPREDDCAASGIVFFYGCLFYIMHFPNWGQYIEDILLYNLLYMLVDHYIDDIKVASSTKEEAIFQMSVLIIDPLAHQRMNLIDPVLKNIAIIYHRLITRRPATKNSIIKLFKAEIEGLNIQKSDSLTREEYYQIALKKGGYTMQVVQDMIPSSGNYENCAFHIGTIMQLIDDSIDVIADQNKGIYTIATYELKTEGNLNKLWFDIIDRIDSIDAEFTIFKMLYSLFAVYLPDRQRELFTKELWSKTTLMNLFDYTYGCDGAILLVQAIKNEINLAKFKSLIKHFNV